MLEPAVSRAATAPRPSKMPHPSCKNRIFWSESDFGGPPQPDGWKHAPAQRKARAAPPRVSSQKRGGKPACCEQRSAGRAHAARRPRACWHLDRAKVLRLRAASRPCAQDDRGWEPHARAPLAATSEAMPPPDRLAGSPAATSEATLPPDSTRTRAEEHAAKACDFRALIGACAKRTHTLPPRQQNL